MTDRIVDLLVRALHGTSAPTLVVLLAMMAATLVLLGD